MATIQNVNGQILAIGGKIVNECCCGENPCEPDGPEIKVTITTSNSGTYNWCGNTWNMPGDSGVTKTACPTYYEAVSPPAYVKPFRMWWSYKAGDTHMRIYAAENWMSVNGYGGLGGTSTYNYPASAVSDVRIGPAKAGGRFYSIPDGGPYPYNNLVRTARQNVDGNTGTPATTIN